MPCLKCKIETYSQAAHLKNLGRGIKGNDNHVAPLCCQRVGIIGCHAGLDQHLETRYWDENLDRAIQTMKTVYDYFLLKDYDKGEQLIRGF